MKKITHNDLERMRRILFCQLLQKDCEQDARDGGNGSNNAQDGTQDSPTANAGKTTVIEVHPTLIGYLYAQFVLLKIMFRHKKSNYLIAIRGI